MAGSRKRKHSSILTPTRFSARLRSKRERGDKNLEEEEDLAPIERVAPEIMWKIIDLVREDVFALRSASPYLRDRVDEYAMLRPPLPVCTVMRIYENKQISDKPPMLKMEAYVKRGDAKLFDLRMLNQSSIDVLSRVKRHSDAVSVSYKIEWNSSDADILEHMRECIGMEVGKLDLYVEDWQTQLDTFFTVFKSVWFPKLAMLVGTMSDNVHDRILKIINAHTVLHLMITVRAVTAANPVKVLFDLSTLVCTLHVQQQSLPGLTNDCRYFFGMHDFDWTDIFLLMFASKLDKLYIQNPYYPNFIRKSSVESLKTRMIQRNKEVWFGVDCIAPLSYRGKSTSIRICHPSRQFESTTL